MVGTFVCLYLLLTLAFIVSDLQFQ